MAAFDRLGRDVVVKPLFGSEGRGIVRVSDPDLAHRTFRTLMRLDAVLYIQRFIDHEGYSDVRILVLDGQVVGGMRRRSPDDFRTNVARAAVAELHQPTAHEIELATRATIATGAFIAGVDLLYDRGGACYVIEVNAVPGWQAFTRVTNIDVAKILVGRLRPSLSLNPTARRILNRGMKNPCDAGVLVTDAKTVMMTKSSEPAGTRTQDLRIKSPLLYQLSYELRLHCNASCIEQGRISPHRRSVKYGPPKKLAAENAQNKIF